MSRASDTGNFIMFLIFAGLVGVYLGDFAFNVVMYIGMFVIIAGGVLYVLNALGIDWRSSLATQSLGETPSSSRSSADGVRELLKAVEAKDGAGVEKLVPRSNVSPFEAVDWNGAFLSANSLAVKNNYEPATRFFKEWSSRGSLARFNP